MVETCENPLLLASYFLSETETGLSAESKDSKDILFKEQESLISFYRKLKGAYNGNKSTIVR